MRYLLDKNILSNKVLRNESGRTDLYIIEDVIDEFAYSSFEESRIKGSGIHVVSLSKKHLEKLKDVVATHGDNLKLINLYECKGAADVAMIAFVLAELQQPETLFEEEYTIVTRDTTLTSVAGAYGIRCTKELDD